MLSHLKILFLFILLGNINTQTSTITKYRTLDELATNNTEALIRLESDYSTVAFSNTFDFLETPVLRESYYDAWKILDDAGVDAVLRRDISIIQGTKSLLDNNLFQNIGLATKGEVSNIHRYTVNGDYLNNPMRGLYSDDPFYIPSVTLSNFEFRSYEAIINGLEKLRSTNRLETGIVYRGRALTEYDYNRLFGSDSPQDIPIKGFVSASRSEKIAQEFGKSNFPGVKYRMVWIIQSKNGVYIDDISDWGKTLGPINHSDKPNIMIQKEVLMEEGYFRKISEPIPLMENGVPKVDLDGTIWLKVELEELSLPLRTITN